MSALMAVDGVGRSYNGLRAVDQVDLQLEAGQRHALIGPNGAGKSTLLGLIAGTISPTAGRISLHGRDITRLAPQRRSRLGIARTFQTPAVYRSLTVMDNMVLALWRHVPLRRRWLNGSAVRAQAQADLEAVGLDALASQLAGAVSHGQRRLLEVAAAISVRPAVLLLDEPAAGLSDDEQRHLVAALRCLPSTTAVLLVEHNQDLVRAVADTVTVLHHGRTVAAGRYEQIQMDAHVREIYLGTSHREAEHVTRP